MYKKIILSMIVVFLFAGCSIQKVLPPIKTYALHVDVKPQRFNHSRCSDDILKVRSLGLNSIPSSDNIYYGVGKYYVSSYTQSQWLQSPSYMINSSLIATLQKSHIFKAVLSYEAQSSSNLLLEYNILDFIQYFNKTRTKSHVEVKINFILINTNNNRLIAFKTFSKKIQTTSQDALGGVQAFGKATGDIISKALVWLFKTKDEL